MTTMKRVTISIPDGLDKKLLGLRKTDSYVRCSYSEIVRQTLERGLALETMEQSTAQNNTEQAREPAERQAG